MIKTIRIRKIEDLMPLLAEQDYRPDLKRNRSSYVYRGMLDTRFKMTTSLKRNCGALQKRLEPAILQNFAKYAVLEDPDIADSVWKQMILGQHYGLPTRLLDWTHSALVALHFSTAEENLREIGEHDSMVWRIDMSEIHSLLPEKYKKVLAANMSSLFSVDMLSGLAKTPQQYDEDMQGRAMVVLEPPSMTTRIVNQYSFFSAIPVEMDDIETFLEENTRNTEEVVLDKSLRWRVRDMLDQLNISERIVYPGLEGLSSWIARHYFVRDSE